VRPVFGKLRYMTSQSMARKFDARSYAEWTKSFPPLAASEGKDAARAVAPDATPRAVAAG